MKNKENKTKNFDKSKMHSSFDIDFIKKSLYKALFC